MTKKKLTKQQQLRIKQNKADVANVKHLKANQYQGLVINRSSNQALIEDETQKTILCDIRKNIGVLAAGDKVIWQQEPQGAVIIARLERHSTLGRPDKRGKMKVIAANVDQMLIVCAPLPKVSFLLIDSYLIAAELLNISPLIIVNKTDLSYDHQVHQVYQNLGYQVLSTSKHQKDTLQQLVQHLQHQTNVFVGQSGVGKSSLINSLIPNLNAATQSISEQSKLGRHTTSTSYLYHLPNSGEVIDSPGIREFALWHIDKAQLPKYFIEIEPYLGKCKYKNCSHLNEPQCAIIQAYQQGKISPSRMASLQSLLSG